MGAPTPSLAAGRRHIRSGGSLTRYLGNLYRTLEAVRARLQVGTELRRCFTSRWTARSELSSPKAALALFSHGSPPAEALSKRPKLVHSFVTSYRIRQGLRLRRLDASSGSSSVNRPERTSPRPPEPASSHRPMITRRQGAVRQRSAAAGHGTDGAVELLEARNPHGERPPRCSSFTNLRFTRHRPPRAPPSCSYWRWPPLRPAPRSRTPPLRLPPGPPHRQRRQPRRVLRSLHQRDPRLRDPPPPIQP